MPPAQASPSAASFASRERPGFDEGGSILGLIVLWLSWARRALALALLCAGAFSVPFAVTWWLERDRSEQPATAAPADAAPVAAPAVPTGPGLSYLPLRPLPAARPPSAPPAQESAETATPAEEGPVLIDEVRDALRRSFYRTVSEDTLDRPSVGQIIDALGDPYTEYLTPQKFAQARAEAVATYQGVGLLVGQSDVGLTVTSALKGPARDAGIRPGDVIVSIDGNYVRALPFDGAISLFRGESGAIVRLMIHRPGELLPRIANVARELITAPAVRPRILNTEEQNLGYIRLLSFPIDAGEQVRNATRELLDQGVDGIVLDLRGNPGGYLREAVEVASVFLRVGVICSTNGLHRQQETFTASGTALAGDLPLVTLVDSHSASAAEIVAAAMRENHRGRVVGVPTFGKTSVQSLIPLESGGGLELTTATYLTPAGNSIAGVGALPHVEALDDPLTRRDEALWKARATLAELVEHRDERPQIHL